jgi:hypothetical protein
MIPCNHWWRVDSRHLRIGCRLKQSGGSDPRRKRGDSQKCRVRLGTGEASIAMCVLYTPCPIRQKIADMKRFRTKTKGCVSDGNESVQGNSAYVPINAYRLKKIDDESRGSVSNTDEVPLWALFPIEPFA